MQPETKNFSRVLSSNKSRVVRFKPGLSSNVAIISGDAGAGAGAAAAVALHEHHRRGRTCGVPAVQRDSGQRAVGQHGLFPA